MQTPVQITFRSMAHSDALAAHLQLRIDKLDHIFDRIVSCHVVIELEGHQHHHGEQHRISVNVGLPGHEIIVNHAPSHSPTIETAYATADRDFEDAERQLEDWLRRQRSHRHEAVTFDESAAPDSMGGNGHYRRA